MSGSKRGPGRPRKERPDYDAAGPEKVREAVERVGSILAEIAALQADMKSVLDEYEHKYSVDPHAVRKAAAIKRRISDSRAATMRRQAQYLGICGIVTWDAAGQASMFAVAA